MRELLVLTLDGQQYGVWKDDILSVGGLSRLHRIPLSPACIAGMSIIDDRAVTLADLSVCVGHGPAPGREEGRILLMPGREKVAGFLVGDSLASLSVPEDAPQPVPPYLATPLIDTCVVHDGAVLPLINITALHNRLLATDQEPPRASLEVSGARPREAGEIERLRLFQLGGEMFGADAAEISGRAVNPGPVARPALLPRFVRGLTFHEGRIAPVVDLAQRVTGRPSDEAGAMLPADVGGTCFGLLVDRDRGEVPAGGLSISVLPPLARTPWISAAASGAEGIIPLLNLPALLSPQRAEEAVRPLPQRYAPDSPFAGLFGREDVDVLEFSLLGARHAVPRSEVEDIADFNACRAVPGAPELVIGVAEYRGELLPLLDLALVFGRRSPVRPGWRLIVLKNGDFRGLVVTGAVYGERRLAPDRQRVVPIRLPQRIVYGCYPEAEAVRLILNVEALAVHFEKALVRELLPVLAPEMLQAPAELVASLLGEEKETIVQHEETMPSDAAPIAVSSPGEALARTVSPPFEPAPAEPAPESIAEAVPEREAAAEAASPQEASGGRELSADHPPAEGPVPATAQERRPAESAEEAPPAHESGTAAEGSEVHREEMPAAREVPARENAGETSRFEQTVEEIAPGEPAVAEEQTGEEAAPLVLRESETAAKEKEETHALPRESPQPVPEVEQPAAAFGSAEPVREKSANEETAPRERETVVPLIKEDRAAPQPVRPAALIRHPKRRWPVYAAVGALLVTLVYFLAGPKGPGEKKNAQEILPEKQAVTLPEKAGHVDKPRPPLVLEVPVDRPLEVRVYNVVEGDTLWDISERFTGNPFNYPRIAGENRIADPDLIFPGQKITLKQKASVSR